MFHPRDDEPTRPQLRVFAGTSLGVGAVLGLVALRSSEPFLSEPHGWLSLALLLVGAVGTVSPPTVRGVYRVAMLITRPIGFVVAQVILALLYFLLVVPLGLLLRLFHHDPLRRRPPGAWIPRDRDAPVDKRRVFRQY